MAFDSELDGEVFEAAARKFVLVRGRPTLDFLEGCFSLSLLACRCVPEVSRLATGILSCWMLLTSAVVCETL